MSDEDKILSQDEFDSQLKEGYDKNLKTEATIQENKEMMAEIQNLKLKTQQKEMRRISNIKDSLENEDITQRNFDKGDMLKSIEDRKNAILFVNDKLSKHFVIAPGSLMAVASMTSNGKSTLTAAITEAIISKEELPTLILSNEETEEDARARVSCLRMKVSFGDYKTNKCSAEQIQIVLDDAEMLARSNKLIVISSKNEEDAYRVTTVDGVISTLKSVNGKVGAVILDYYQNVNTSEFGSIEPWHVNNRLASELNVLKGLVSYPIIVFAQCKGITTDKQITDKGALDYENNHPMYRWKGGQNLLVYATDVIELVKDFDNSSSILFAHKVRFGHGDLQRKHCLPFDKKMQRFTEWSPKFDAEVTASKVVKKSQDETKEAGLARIFGKGEE